MTTKTTRIIDKFKNTCKVMRPDRTVVEISGDSGSKSSVLWVYEDGSWRFVKFC